MTTAVRTMTAEDLLSMRDDGFRRELVRGEIKRMPPAGYRHGRIAARVTAALERHVSAHGLGAVCAAETGFKIASDPDTVRAPDVAFLCRERVDSLGDVKGYWPGAPDLAVEVVSPGDGFAELQDEVFDWLAAGTRMVVVIEPERRAAMVYRSLTEIRILGVDETLEGEDVVAGWSLPLKEVFG